MVAVTSVNVTVIVAAGQSTLILAGQPPQEPTFRMDGEGMVEESSPTRWRIAGRTFETNEHTVVAGQPQVGDWVAFEARVLLDGAHMADRISLLERAPENRFVLVGLVDAIGPSEWTIAGRAVRVDDLTGIDPNIQVGALVEVRGGVAQDATL